MNTQSIQQKKGSDARLFQVPKTRHIGLARGRDWAEIPSWGAPPISSCLHGPLAAVGRGKISIGSVEPDRVDIVLAPPGFDRADFEAQAQLSANKS